MKNPSDVRKIVGVISGSLSVLLLGGCVGSPPQPKTEAQLVECPGTPSDTSATVRLGFQIIPGPELFIRDQRVLEACLPNADIIWTQFPTGPDVVQGFAGKSLDVGFMGSTPAAKALSAPLNIDLIVPQINAVNQEHEALIAKTATTIKQLKGKKIATPFSSTAHYSLLNALKHEGLDPTTDVEIVNVSPDKLPAAWASDDIEAAFVWEPTLSEISKTGNKLTDAGQVGQWGAPTLNLTVVDAAYAEKNPDIVELWVQLESWAISILQDNPQQFITANSAQTGMSEPETSKQLSGVHFFTGEEQKAALEQAGIALYKTAVFLETEGGVQAYDEKHYEEATNSQWVTRALTSEARTAS